MNIRKEKGFRNISGMQSPHLPSRASAKMSHRSQSVDIDGTDNEVLEPKAEVKIVVGTDEEANASTIQEAIDMANPGTVIKIDEGRYRESIKITKPGLRIEPRYKDREKGVYLLGEEGPSITVDLKPNETCMIKGLIVAHFGSNIANKFGEQMKGTEAHSANPKLLSKFEISKDMDCAIMILGGSVIVRNCMISLKSLPDNIKSTIPSFIAMPGTKVNIVSSEFRGNEIIQTAGLISLSAEILVSNSKFHNFKAGGVFVSGNNDTSIKVADTEVSRCGIVGIYSQGEDCKPLFLRLKVNNIEGPAIKIYKANRAKIKGCEITKCQTGVEVISGDPYIVLNKIFKNFENGILTVAKNELRWDTLIKMNEIYKNKDNGILWWGHGKISFC